MQAFVDGGGFLGLGNTLRSLTIAPAQAALHQAHRMARRRLETGGGVAATEPKCVKANAAPTDFILPPDIAAEEVAAAIEAKLRGDAPLQPTDAPPVIERRAGGRVVVPARHLLRLGDGRFDRGREFMRGVIKKLRAGRMRRK